MSKNVFLLSIVFAILFTGFSFSQESFAANTVPIVNAGLDVTINEGDTFTSSGSFTDPDADTWTATVDYGDGSGSQPLTLSDKTFVLNHIYANDGSFTVTINVDDGSTTASDTVLVTVNNVVPTIDAGPNVTIDEGEPFLMVGSFIDAGNDVWVALLITVMELENNLFLLTLRKFLHLSTHMKMRALLQL